MAAAQTFLQLCQAVNEFIRAGNNVPFTNVSAPSNQLQTDIVYTVNQAWQQLQNDHPSWQWMKTRGQADLPTNTSTGTARTIPLSTLQGSNATYQHWMPFTDDRGTRYCWIYDAAVPNTVYPLYFIPYQNWRGVLDRPPRPVTMPTRMTEWPDFTLEFDGTPSFPPSGVNWRIKFDYHTVNTVLAVNTDTPNMPADYQDVLLWWAIDLYCRTRSNTGPLAGEAKAEKKRQLDRLYAYQLPEMIINGRYT